MTLLKEYIQKNKEIANQNIRCGSCGNALVHCGKYEIASNNNNENGYESIICETCSNNMRVPNKATKIDDNGNIVNFVIPIEISKDKEKTSKENPRDKFKRINRPETIQKEDQQQNQQQQVVKQQNVDIQQKEKKEEIKK